jgi:hypothetical protein
VVVCGHHDLGEVVRPQTLRRTARNHTLGLVETWEEVKIIAV